MFNFQNRIVQISIIALALDIMEDHHSKVNYLAITQRSYKIFLPYRTKH